MIDDKKLYGVWRSMKNRCTNPNNKDFPDYGARGISVCSEWHSFPRFQAWALANGYAEGLTLDRTDNDGSYEPANCRWVTRKEQALNRRPRRGVPTNGGWHDAHLDLPKEGEQVLCVKQNKAGVRSLCFGSHWDNRPLDDGWVTGGGCNNVIYWMPLPKIPENSTEQKGENANVG